MPEPEQKEPSVKEQIEAAVKAEREACLNAVVAVRPADAGESRGQEKAIAAIKARG